MKRGEKKFKKPNGKFGFVVSFVLMIGCFLAFTPMGSLAATVDVAAGNFFFNPSPVNVSPSDTVRWTISGTHTVTSGSSSGGLCQDTFDSGTLTNGSQYLHTFNTAGTCNYRCDLHFGIMDGVVQVGGATTTTTTTTVPGSTTTTTSPGVELTTYRASVDSSGTEGNQNSRRPSINANGQKVAFQSNASNLVANDTNGVTDIFSHNIESGVTERASVDGGGTGGNGNSIWGYINNFDGRYVAFASEANNLIPADTNGQQDIFVRDLQTGATIGASIGTSGAIGNARSYEPSNITADGKYVAFASGATNLVLNDTNGVIDMFVRDIQAGTTVRVSVDSSGNQANNFSGHAAISSTGRFVAFSSSATNLVPGDTNGVFDIIVHDRDFDGDGIFDEPGAIATSRVSVDSAGVEGNGDSTFPSISGDGRFVAFQSDSTNLVLNDTNAVRDIFVHDRDPDENEIFDEGNGETTRTSVHSNGTEGNDASGQTSVSLDGRFVGFASLASNLVSGDTNGVQDIFTYDRLTQTTSRVSVDADGNEGNGLSAVPSLSSSGRFVTFWSDANNLVPNDTGGWSDVFVRNTGFVDSTVASGTGDQQGQTAAWNPIEKEYLMLWSEFGALDIRGARLNKYGRVIAGEGNLPIIVDAERQVNPWIAYGGTGLNRGYLAVWIKGRGSDPTGTDIHGAWILPDGTVDSTFIVTDKTDNQRAASVIYDPSADRFLITWIDDENGLSNRDIYRAVYLPGGGVQSGPTAIITTSDDQRGPFARYDYGNNRYFMVWFDDRNGNFDIFGSRVDSNGNLLDGTGLAISTATGAQRNARMTDRRPADGIDNFVLAWVDFRNGNPDIFGAVVDESGAIVGTDFEVSGGPSGQRAVNMDVDYLRSKQAMVSWIDDRITPTVPDIFRARIDQTGTVSAEQVVIDSSSVENRGPLVLYTEIDGVDNGFLVTWRDNRNAVDYDLFSGRIYP